jgi:hypothetical protein
MGYRAEVLADSISPSGVRLTTLEVEYPHAIHKDIMTHRMFSRNFQSFRAVPTRVLMAKLREDHFVPDEFNAVVKGMGRGEAVKEQARAKAIWEQQFNDAMFRADSFLEMEIAKEQTNFLLQDFSWITGIITATEWDNFFALRLAVDEGGDPRARKEVHKIARLMNRAIYASKPQDLPYGEWHLPLVTANERLTLSAEELKKISVGRCARVSYLTHDGVRDPSADIALHDRLAASGHMSPFEHVARPITGVPGRGSGGVHEHFWSGNFWGWHQYRKDIPGESNYGEIEDAA